VALLIASVLLPLAAAAATPLAGSWRRGAALSASATAASLALLLCSAAIALSGSAPVERYPLAPELGLVELRGDGFNLAFALVIAALSTAASAYSGRYMEGERGPRCYYSLLLLCTSAMLGAVLSDSLATFLMFLEMTVVPLALLIAFWGSSAGGSAALKYFLFNEAGALVTAAGLALVYVEYGTLSFEGLRRALAGAPAGSLVAPALLLSVGPLVKMAIVPLHSWMPDAYTEAPTPVSALAAAAADGIGGWALARILLLTMGPALEALRPALAALAAVTILYGGLCALAQDDLKRLLAYSSISQMGYMLLGLAGGGAAGAVGAALLYASHGFAKASLFMVAGSLQRRLGTGRVSQMGGLAQVLPVSAVSTLTSFLCLAGVPPTVGFWAELEVFSAALSSVASAGSAPLLAAAAAFVATACTLTAGYGLRTFRRAFFGPLARPAREGLDALSLTPLALSLAAVALGAYPRPLVELALRGVEPTPP